MAASEFFCEDRTYDLDFKKQPNDGKGKKTGSQMLDMYRHYVEKYGLIFIEDPFEQVRDLQQGNPGFSHAAGFWRKPTILDFYLKSTRDSTRESTRELPRRSLLLKLP